MAAACSGKHGGAPAIAPTPGIAIEQANASDLALLTLQSVFGFIDAVAAGSSLLLAEPPPPNPMGPPPVFTSPVTVTDFGPEGGEVLRSWEDHDGNQRLSPGDTVLSVLNGYAEGGKSYSGIVMVAVEAIIGVPPIVDAGVARGRLSMVNLAVSAANGTKVWNGSMRFVRERRSTVDLLQVELDSAILADGATLRPGTRIARDFYAPINFTLAADGSLGVEGATGDLVFETDRVLNAFDFLPQPYTGLVNLFGNGGAEIRVTATDTFQLRIDSDLDGDGEIDETSTTAWPL